MRTGVDKTEFEEAIGGAWERGIERKKKENNLTRQADIATAMNQSAPALSYMKSGIQRTTATDIYLAFHRCGIVEPLEELARQCGYTLTAMDCSQSAKDAKLAMLHVDATRACGDLQVSYAEAMVDGKVDAEERIVLAPLAAEAATRFGLVARELGKH